MRIKGEMSVRMLLGVVAKSAVPMVLCGVLCAIIAVSLTAAALGVRYESSVKLYIYEPDSDGRNYRVSMENPERDLDRLTYSQEIVKGYIGHLDSLTFFTALSGAGDYTPRQIKDMTEFIPVDDTGIFEVKVTAKNQKDAASVATFAAYLASWVLSGVYENARVKIIDPAAVSEVKVNRTKAALAGFLIGIFVVELFFFVKYVIYDVKIRSADEIRRQYGVVVLAETSNLTR
ncbi:MAG: hypothetical protein LBL35_08110 [Clostridiales bacterium]|jgi:capsular polysaccharide biosynthesis protein|nr:hypothetical protein [Clostridiales bacterium]